jgi:hypothetical protein
MILALRGFPLRNVTQTRPRPSEIPFEQKRTCAYEKGNKRIVDESVSCTLQYIMLYTFLHGLMVYTLLIMADERKSPTNNYGATS